MFLNVTELQVQRALSILNPKKASGPDKIPNWFLKEYSYLLAFPVKEILNCSFREQRLPAIWKMADVSPLPKKKPVEKEYFNANEASQANLNTDKRILK